MDMNGDNGASPPDDTPSNDEPTELATATCPEFVAHYNQLACTTDTLTNEGSCSAGSEEDCSGFDAFNACRIENTFCDSNNSLVENQDACFALLDCSVR